MKPFTIFNRFLTITLTTVALLSTSCKKDNEKRPDAMGVNLVRLEESATSFSTFSYNTAGQVVKMTAHESFGSQSFDVTYKGSKPKLVTSNEGSIEFNYQNDKLDVAELFNDQMQATPAGEIKFNYVNGTVNNMVFFHTLEDTEEAAPVSKTVFEYYTNGDIKKELDYIWNPLNGQFSLSGSTVYEYDNYNNPLLALGDVYKVSFKAVSKHNPVKELIYDENDILISTNTYTYTYNNNGYPVKAQKQITSSGQTAPIVSNVKYTYQ